MKDLLAKAACQPALADSSVELIPCRSDHANSCKNGTPNLLWIYEDITSDWYSNFGSEESFEIERGINEGIIESSESSLRCHRPLFYKAPSILRQTTDGALDIAASARVKGFPLAVPELTAKA